LDVSRANLEHLAVDPDRLDRLLKPFMNDDALAKRLCLFLVSENSD
jgi:hypothetical protein